MRISDWSSDVCSSDLLPLEILEFDAQALVLALLFLAIAANVAFTLQHVENANAQLGRRAGHAVLASLLAVADTGEHITQRIGQCHLSNPYQLDLVRSEEHTSELQSLMRISIAVYCLQKNNQKNN